MLENRFSFCYFEFDECSFSFDLKIMHEKLPPYELGKAPLFDISESGPVFPLTKIPSIRLMSWF